MRAHAIGAAAGLLLLGLVTVDGRQDTEPNVGPAAATESNGRSPRNANYDIDVTARSCRTHADRTRNHPLAQHQRTSHRRAAVHLYWNAWRNLESPGSANGSSRAT